jgi:hypothetical protein
MRRRLAVRSTLGLALLLAAGCGTTVPLARQGEDATPLGGTPSLNQTGAQGTARTGRAGPASEGAGPSSSASAARGGTGLEGGSPVTAGAAKPLATGPNQAGGEANVGGPAASALGPGVSAKSVAVGIIYVANGSQADAAVGGSSFTTGNELQENQAVVADLNAHGGIAGRTVVPYYASLDLTSTQSVQVQEQSACASVTQDHRVFAVLTPEAHDTFIQCVQSAGSSTILDGGLTDANSASFAAHPSYVEPSSINLDRLATSEVSALASENYFTGWNTLTGAAGSSATKVGIVSFDDPRYQEAVQNALRPALARIGHAVADADVQYVYEAQTEADAGQESAGVSSAVLHLSQDGVTHVVFLEHGGLPVLLFLNQAQSQGYHPRYGLNTQDAPEALVQGGEVPAAQMNGAEGIGWIPGADLPFGETNSYLSTPSARRCLSIMNAAGQSPTSADAVLTALTICDQLWFLKAAMEASGPALTRSALVENIDRLASFPSALTLGTRFSASQHDGAGQARRYSYSTGCSCWSYAGSPINIG